MSSEPSGRNDLVTRALTASRLLTVRWTGANEDESEPPVQKDVLGPGRPLQDALVAMSLYEDGQRVDAALAVDQLAEALAAHPNAFLWIGLFEPNHAALRSVGAQLGLPALAIEDAVHAHQRPKVEDYGDSVFVAFRTTAYVDSVELITTGEVMAFVGDRYIVTVRHGELGELSGVRATLETQREVLALGPSAVLYAVADRVVDGFGDAINGLALDVDEVEAQVFGATSNRTTERLYNLKREALELRRSVQPAPQVLQRLVDGSLQQVRPQLRTYFRDVEDHAQRAAENLMTIDELLSGAVQANLALVGKQQNDDMRRLAAGAAIFAVLTLIVGIYGMNFDNMPELHWKYGYFIVLGLMVLISLALYRAFRRAGWL